MRALLGLAVLILSTFQHTSPGRIDRETLVRRHAPTLTALDVEAPLTVGNGEFAFTADATGLQTFPELYADTIPLATQSQWGWHSAPNPDGWSMARYAFAAFDSHGRRVGYADIPDDRRTPEVAWLRANPHRLHLGRVGFRLRHADGRAAVPSDVTQVRQTLDLWRGVLVSRFVFEGEPVDVETAVHPARDVLAVRVRSALAADGRLAVELRFPYGTGHATAADWTRPEAHATWFRMGGRNAAIVERRLDADRYFVVARWSEGARVDAAERHVITLVAALGSRELSLAAEFVPRRAGPALNTADVLAAAAGHWRHFWSTGGAIDLSGSRDPRWRELERRIVLSQYLTAVNGAGRYPPQETGLTFNSWEGKFHLEMHWWHVAHFAQWGRLPLMERSLGYYDAILPKARATAARQGYRGARWPKMTSPTGDESPSTIGPFLVWQQPHPIYFAELVYRQRPTRETLERFRTVVFETAEFMASFAEGSATSEGRARLTLGPPLHCAQEVFPRDTTTGCSYELAYWGWGLETAQQWRGRLGLPRSPAWDRVLRDLERPGIADGRYLFVNSRPDSYTDRRWSRDHPSVLAMLGVLPGRDIDRDAMRRTFDWVWANWQWPDTWGWDYPMAAMTAARLGDPARAIDALLLDTPKNRYRANGHNHQRPGLTVYLPGNGGLLSAVAMMAAGWDGAPAGHAPGFPADGSWSVRWEGLRRMP
jgi:hypothetical protein